MREAFKMTDEIARELLKNEHVKLTVKQANKKGWNSLHYAVKKGYKVLTELLLEPNMYIAYMQDKQSMMALHVATADSSWQIMETIIKRCPDCSELVDKLNELLEKNLVPALAMTSNILMSSHH